MAEKNFIIAIGNPGVGPFLRFIYQDGGGAGPPAGSDPVPGVPHLRLSLLFALTRFCEDAVLLPCNMDIIRVPPS